MRKLTHEQIISEFREVHGTKYDYTKVVYKGANKKVTIICPKHGIFTQTPSNHKRGNGCVTCGSERTGTHRQLTQEEVIQQFREVHGTKYDYSKVEYKGDGKKVNIICPKHGIFTHLPNSHKKGSRCPECVNKLPKYNTLEHEQIISQFREVHGTKYDYSKVEYSNNRTKVKIKCSKHGIFEQTPNNHKRGCGCPSCRAERNLVGKNEGEVFIPFMRDILSDYDVTLSEQHIVEREIGKYFIDLYIPEMKLAIEYDEVHHDNQKDKDKERQSYIERELGCKFIRVDDKRFMDDKQYATTLLENYFPNIKKETIEDLFF